jgi:hypothetical protein
MGMRAIARRSARLALVVLVLAAVGCGSDEDQNTSTDAKNGRLIFAADVPGMRLGDLSPLLGPDGVAELAGGEIFKDPPEEVMPKLSAAGLTRGIAELWFGAGTGAGAMAMEFGSEAQAREMLDYMYEQLFKACPGDPRCAEQGEVQVSGIPGAKGQRVTPIKKPERGAEVAIYKVLFEIGAVVYFVRAGEDVSYDPVQISQENAFEIFRAVYDRVKGLAPERVFPTGTPEPFDPCPGPGPCPQGTGTS